MKNIIYMNDIHMNIYVKHTSQQNPPLEPGASMSLLLKVELLTKTTI
jgi:hypothetical protein